RPAPARSGERWLEQAGGGHRSKVRDPPARGPQLTTVRQALVADRIAELLVDEQVEFIVGFPENRLLNSAAVAGIRPSIAWTERVASTSADGFARVTGGRRLGGVAVQPGPGAEAAFPAVAQAYGDRPPLLILPSEYDRDDQDVAPNFGAAEAFRSITGWSV